MNYVDEYCDVCHVTGVDDDGYDCYCCDTYDMEF